MAKDTSKKNGAPGWYAGGVGHVWLPYTQMKRARPPLAVAAQRAPASCSPTGANWSTALPPGGPPATAITSRISARRSSGNWPAMPHVMFGGLVHEQAATLARRLADMLPGALDRVFFSDSGSVAVEVALKMALQFWINHGVKGRTKFIAFKGGYHGDTSGAMAVSDSEDGMHALFAGLLPEHHAGRSARHDAHFAALDTLLAQRASEHRRHYRRASGAGRRRDEVSRRGGAASACARWPTNTTVLLIFDEIFTGFGRTGRCSPARRPVSCPISSRCQRR